MVLFRRDLWVPQQTGGIWCLSGGGLPASTALLRVMMYNFVQKCIVLANNNLMSVLALLWLSSACNVWWRAKLLLSTLGGSTVCVTFWAARYSRVDVPQPRTRKVFLLAFLMLTGVYTFYHAPIPCTFQPNQCHLCHAPFNNLVSCPDYFSGMRLQYTFHLHIYAMHTLHGNTRSLIFHILWCCQAAISMWRINTTQLPRQHTRMLLISRSCSGFVYVTGYIPSWGVLLHNGARDTTNT